MKPQNRVPSFSHELFSRFKSSRFVKFLLFFFFFVVILFAINVRWANTTNSNIPIATGLVGYRNRSNAHQTGTTRYRVVILRATNSVQLVYANYYSTGTDPRENPNSNSISIKASIEFGGTSYPVYFSGSRTATITPGGNVTSDSVSIPLTTGSLPYIRTYWDAGTGGYVPSMSMQTLGAGYSGPDSYTYDVDSVDNLGNLSSELPAYLYGPVAMIGQPTDGFNRSVGVVGDSTVLSADGTYIRASTASTDGGFISLDGGGWPSRALRTAGIGSISVSFGGEAASYFSGSNINARLPLVSDVAHITHWLIVYGRNDLLGTLQDIQTSLLNIANLAVSKGIKPIAVTIPPKTTDTSDGPWGSIATQTTQASTNTVRIAVNDWLRTVPAPFVSVWDVADAVETPRNSGVWNIGRVTSSGTASSADATHLSVSPAAWAANQFASGADMIRITSGTGNGQIRQITGNNTTQVTITPAWTINPDNTSSFETFYRLTTDGVHPSNAGHYLMSQQIASKVFSDIADVTPPTISSVSSSTPTSSGATITWTTDENGSSKVDYGLTNSYGSSTTEVDTSTRVTSHLVVLSGLSSCTTYHYRVRSKDAATNETVDSDNTFTTSGCTGSPPCNNTIPTGMSPWLYEANANNGNSISLRFTNWQSPVTSKETNLQGYLLNVNVKDTKGNRVKGAEVTIHSTPQTKKTDKDGVASFSDIEPGNHIVQIAYNSYQGEQSINLTGDVKEFNLNITIQAQNAFLTPKVLVVIGALVLVIALLVFKLVKKNKLKKS